MSITFWCPDAPTESYKPFPEDEPEFVTTRSTLPEVNMANGNALSMLDLMGLATGEDDYCGTVPVEKLPGVIERLQRVVADPVERAAALEAPTINGVPQGQLSLGELLRIKLGQPPARSGPTMLGGGRSDDYVRSRARALLDVFTAAQAHSYEVSWG
jgi:hypothetical protein